MTPLAGAYSTINQLVNGYPLITGLLGTAISGLAVLVYRYLRRDEIRLNWSVISDRPLDPHSHLGRIVANALAAASTITVPAPGTAPARGTGPASAMHGSQVIVELRNSGRRVIQARHFVKLPNSMDPDFRVEFPGRQIIRYEALGNDEYRQLMEADPRCQLIPGQQESLMLPAPKRLAAPRRLAGRGRIKLDVLLVSNNPGLKIVDVSGTLTTGDIVEKKQPGLPRKILIGFVALVVIAGLMAAGGAIGVTVANNAVAPTATCGQGTLTIEGSTAFAPIMTLVATEYEQQCPRAHITVTGNNSGHGLSQLEGGANPPDIAMYDGLPLQVLKPGISGQPIGDIIMAVVGNDSLPPSVFQQGQGLGLGHDAITQAFAQSGSVVPGLPGLSVKTVGRPGNSGTREAFIQTVAGGNEQANGTVPTMQSTMELLGYVNETPDSIGYAEADALPFFPSVREIAIDGVLPSPQAALNGSYKFVATERLYTRGQLTGLGADFLSFLTSSPVLTPLRTSTSFLGCPDLAGSKLSADCAGG
jgi:ABC-type phosphate transport system substrate-binding protein